MFSGYKTMGNPSDREELIAAWRALSSTASTVEGWRTIPLALGTSERFRAGRHFPDNTEALLVSFEAAALRPIKSLPQGGGFEVCSLDVPESGNRSWIALRRRPLASIDLFSAMATDVVTMLVQSENEEEYVLIQSFLYRIRAWQDFMGRTTGNRLSPEEEVGLFGELTVLKLLIENGIAAAEASDAWLGPEGGVQDFRLGHGALEVKSTLSSCGFPARVWSLDQLDDSAIQPLVIAALRLKTSDTGVTLTGLVAAIMNLFVAQSAASSGFEAKLIRAGFLHAIADQYLRKLESTELRFLVVDANFPRLTRQIVPMAVTHATYVVDLDAASADCLANVEAVLEKLGAL